MVCPRNLHIEANPVSYLGIAHMISTARLCAGHCGFIETTFLHKIYPNLFFKSTFQSVCQYVATGMDMYRYLHIYLCIRFVCVQWIYYICVIYVILYFMNSKSNCFPFFFLNFKQFISHVGFFEEAFGFHCYCKLNYSSSLAS